MANNNDYEQLYDKLADYVHHIHLQNQRRIRIGLKCIIIIPLIFLILLFWTNSSKIIFLTLWIVSLFIIAIFLITIEYLDYKLQSKIHEIDDSEVAEIPSLLSADLSSVEMRIRAAIRMLDDNLNAKEELVYHHEEISDEAFEQDFEGEDDDVENDEENAVEQYCVNDFDDEPDDDLVRELCNRLDQSLQKDAPNMDSLAETEQVAEADKESFTDEELNRILLDDSEDDESDDELID